MQKALFHAPDSVFIVTQTEDVIGAARLKPEFVRAPQGYGIRSYGLDEQHRVTVAVAYDPIGNAANAGAAQVMYEFAEGRNLLALIMLEKRVGSDTCTLVCMRDSLAEYHPLVGQARKVAEECGCGEGTIRSPNFVPFAKRIFDSFSRFAGSN